MNIEDDITGLKKEIEYYHRQLDELSGEGLKNDYVISELRNELKQKERGFALLSQLQDSYSLDTPLNVIIDSIVKSINVTLGMERTVFLIPDSSIKFKPSSYSGYNKIDLNEREFIFSEDVKMQGSYLLVNSKTISNVIIEDLRTQISLPFFIAIPVYVQNVLAGILAAGRIKEARPFSPPLDEGDVNILKAVTSIIARTILNKNILSLKTEIEEQKNEREQIVNIFGQQVSKNIAEELIKKKDIAGEKRSVAIMFLDIRNFTPFAESKNPEEVVEYLNSLFEFMIEIIEKNGGVINQFLGDGFMTTFGAPVSNGNPSVNAVNAALEILKTIEEKNCGKQILPTKVGIGIHSGEAVTGNVGSSLRKQYSITGNVVILAARIEQLTKQFDAKLIVSADVWKNINHNKIKAAPLGLVPVKGRSEPVSLFKLA